MAKRCAVQRLQCPADAEAIAQLASTAEAQQWKNSGFTKNIFPWRSLCDKGEYLHYVAQDATGIVCGWLTASPREFEGRTYMYLVEIATRRIRDGLYGGVGQSLHHALLRDAIASGCDFVYLYPLDADVAELYKRPEWAYLPLRPDVPHLFRILTRPPSHRLLETLRPPSPNEILMRAHELAEEGTKNVALQKRIQRASSKMKQDPAKLEELEQFLEYMEVVDLPMKSRRAELWAFFTKYLQET
jgi:hypothetical protein